MSFHGYDPGDCNNWYQSPQLGLFPTSPTGYIGGYYCLPSHPHVTQFPSHPSYRPLPSQFPFQPSYSPPPPPSHTIINGFVFPHQFPSTHTHHSPDSNPNPWIYPFISQSQSYEPHSQSVSTKSMTTTPIYHSTPPPPACEQPHTIAYPKPLCPIPEYDRISLETDRVHIWELPIVDSGYYSFTPEPMVELKGVEKPQSPPRGSGELQVHKDHTDAKLCEMQKSFKSSMDTFMSEFREELRLLRGSSQSPGIQVDNTLKFGSQADPTIATSLTASGKPSSSTTATAGGSIRISERLNFNPLHHEVLSDLNNDSFAVVVSGCSSEDNIIIGMTDKLNTVSNSMGVSKGNKEPEIQSVEGVTSVMWKNNSQSHHFQHTNLDSFGKMQVNSERVLELILEKWKSRVTAKTQSVPRGCEMIRGKDNMLANHGVHHFPQFLSDEANVPQHARTHTLIEFE